MMLKAKYQLLYITLILILLSACNDNSIYNHKIPIENQQWSYSQIPEFNWDVKDTSQWYRILLAVRHKNDLNHRNLYVKCNTTFPDNSNKDQILSLELYDEAGKPYGVCRSSSCTTDIPLIPKTKFPIPGNYKLSIEQYGRDTIVPGLHSLELTIVKVQDK
jgi:gliding motility-associated lipoprotein GldH